MSGACGKCGHHSHGECWEAAMVKVREADSERVDALTDLEKTEDRAERLQALLVDVLQMSSEYTLPFALRVRIGIALNLPEVSP